MTAPRNDAPLAGIRVLDFTQNLPGPYATMVLTSLGAEVVKVEPPKGDTARSVPRLFELVNGGKKSIVVDLKDPAARDALAAIVPSFDVLVEGFRPGVLTELGFGPEALLASNPRLVYCSISAYGQAGPYRDRPGHDLNLQALSGACDLSRDEADVPHGAALPIADLSSSMTAVTAILAALVARGRDDRGRFVDVALTDTVTSWAYVWGEGLVPAELRFSEVFPRLERVIGAGEGGVRGALAKTLRHPRTRSFADSLGARVRASEAFRRIERARLHLLPHYDLYRTRDDRYVAVGIVDEDKFWGALCRGLGLDDLVSIPLVMRAVLGPELRRRLARAFRERSRGEWLARLDLDQVPVSPVLTVDEALADPQLASRRPSGATPAVPPPLAAVVDTRSPRLGEHTISLLTHAARRA